MINFATTKFGESLNFFSRLRWSQNACRKHNLIGIIITFLTLPKILPVWAGLCVTSESFLGIKFNSRASESFWEDGGEVLRCSGVL